MRNVYIINPKAGKHDHTVQFMERIRAVHATHGEEPEIYLTQRAGHGEELARAAAEKDDAVRIWAVGGDGTVLEVVRGAEFHKNVAVGVYPCGSGNDFVRTAIQNRYSMMARWYEELFPMLEELHIGYVAFSPLANGFLSGRYDKNTRFEAGTDYRSVMPQFQPEGIDQNRALLDLLNKLAGEKNATPAQISLAWMLCKKPYIVPIPGTRKAARLQENAGAADVCLSAAEVQAIDTALGGMEMSQVFGGSRVVQ